MGSRMKEDQSRVSALIQDTVTLLCKNGLIYKKNMKIQGLLGITLDDDEVFIIPLNQSMESMESSGKAVSESKAPASNTMGRSPAKRPRLSSPNRDGRPAAGVPSQIVGSVVISTDVQVKSEPDTNMLEHSNVQTSAEGGTLTESLNIGTDSFTAAMEATGAAPPKELSFCDTTATSAEQPFVTGMIMNQSNYDPGQHAGDTGFPWVGNAAQGSPSVSDWTSQMTQQSLQSVGMGVEGQAVMSQGSQQVTAQSIASQAMASQVVTQPGTLQPGMSQSIGTAPAGHQRQQQQMNQTSMSPGTLKRQQFQKRWPSIWPWLEFDTKKQAMFCRPCVRTGKVNAMTKGCQSFKTSSMMRHEALSDHKAAIAPSNQDDPTALEYMDSVNSLSGHKAAITPPNQGPTALEYMDSVNSLSNHKAAIAPPNQDPAALEYMDSVNSVKRDIEDENEENDVP